MKFRLIASLILGFALASSPALAKKPKPEDVVKSNTASLSTAVDLDVSQGPDDVLYLDLSSGGRIAIRLVPQWAPNHVERIKSLVREGFYNGLIFHRVIDGFMAQTGDPTGTGGGGSQRPDLEAEFNSVPHLRGMLSMARTNEPNSANSQFFIVFYPRFALDKKYTIFGRVIRGMDVADAIQRGEPPENPTRILQASLGSEGKPPPAPSSAVVEDVAISITDLNSSISD
jgi:cyclophilin family peptidyl-prolyl cis-trans isomerase